MKIVSCFSSALACWADPGVVLGGLVEPTQYFTIIFLVKKRPVEYLQSQLHLDNVGGCLSEHILTKSRICPSTRDLEIT